MNFAGFQEISLQDYPGKMSSIVWTQGCNLDCWWCYNPQMIKKISLTPKISEKKVINFLKTKNKDKIWVDAITICGGEPTIQKGLFKFLQKIKKEFPYLKVKLDTNGTNLLVLEKLIENNLLDYIAMDVKISQLNNKDYLNSVVIVNKFIKKYDGEFRWTMHPGTIEFEKKTKVISKIFNNSKIYFQKFTRQAKLNNDNNKKEYTIKELKSFEKYIKNNFKNGKFRW